MSECQIRLREQGLPYPRTCQKCKFSGCAEGLHKPVALVARIAALEAALKEIAQQKTTDEMEPLDVRHGDFEGAYDTMIEAARAALVKP